MDGRSGWCTAAISLLTLKTTLEIGPEPRTGPKSVPDPNYCVIWTKNVGSFPLMSAVVEAVFQLLTPHKHRFVGKDFTNLMTTR